MTPGMVVGGRYTVTSLLGSGGAASVYGVDDAISGERRALKRLVQQSDARRQRRATQLFEREFHTLAQLAHPRIVSVFDYAVDDDGPYYTMELLDGGDLHKLAPVDFRRACAIARDVCSALSLLHSRRMVHRDLSARNVRCTSDGMAKVIDFGAMVPMGPTKYLVGTPPYSAPEAVSLEPLDARTDLFALGATLYFTLTGRHAFPARDFNALRQVWQRQLPRPSELAADIPPALDALVLDLLRLDSGARPTSAAEVMERLAAIEGRPIDEQLLVAQAYLDTPNLIGRDGALARVRKVTMRAQRGRGGSVRIDGAPGVGRSRLLHACALQARILGAVVLRADGDDAAEGDYGAVRRLCRQLLDNLPERTLEAARPMLGLLGHALPELLAAEPSSALEPIGDAATLRSRLQSALRTWLIEVSRDKPLVLVVDDFERIDEPSAALFALLAHDLKRHSIGLVVSHTRGASARAAASLKLLSDVAAPLPLEGLNLRQVELLLGSVFGEQSQLELLAHRMHSVAGGNPRAVMQLAQHLIDRGVIRYQAGSWFVPPNIGEIELPEDMSQALRHGVATLEPGARELASTFALCSELQLGFEECLLLTEHKQPGPLARDLDALLALDVVRRVGERYVLSQPAWVPALTDGLDAPTRAALHARIADMLEQLGSDEFRRTTHLLRAGKHEQALQAMVAFATESQRVTDEDPEAFHQLVQSLPNDWLKVFDEVIALCDTLKRPASEKFMLQSRLAGIAAVIGANDHTHLPAMLARLERDSGLCDYAQTSPELPAMERLTIALTAAQQRYDQSSADERVLDPGSAIRQLARGTIQGAAKVAYALDLDRLHAMPGLGPLTPLSPALAVIEQLMLGMEARMTARMARARGHYDTLLERTSQPDRAGLDESHHRFMRFGVMSGVGMIEAGMGKASCLSWADAIESDPLYQINALQIRMLNALFQGDLTETRRYQKRIDVLRIRNSARQFFEGTHLLWQLTAHALSGDLTRIKRTIDEIEPFAAQFAGWAPARHYGLGEYHLARGAAEAALQELSLGLAQTAAGTHQLWANLAGAEVRALVAAGHASLAIERGEQHLASAQAAEICYAQYYLQVPLSLAYAELEHFERAVASAERAIEALRTIGSTGVVLGLAHEARARIALAMKDEEGADRHLQSFAESFSAAANPALSARLERLRQQQLRRNPRSAPPALDKEIQHQAIRARVALRMSDAIGSEERALRMLQLLVENTGSHQAFLFSINDGVPSCVARLDADEVPSAVEGLVRDYLRAECEVTDETKTSFAVSSTAGTEWSATLDERYCPVLLSHAVSGGLAITGIAVILVGASQRFVYPGVVATQLSRLSEECGDSKSLIVAA